MEIFINAVASVCCAGKNIEEIWKSVTDGSQSGIKKVKPDFGEKEFWAARVVDSELPETTSKYKMHIMKLEEAALNQLSSQVSKLKEKYGSERIAVCVGSCDNGTEFSVKNHKVFFKDGKFPENYDLEIQGADYPATFVSEKFGVTGPSLAFSTACSSGAASIIKAAQLLKSGATDAVIAGGVDIASDTVLLGFDALEAVSENITNPFSKNRSGITLGEAASFFILTKENCFAEKNPVKILGYGESADAYHATSPDPSGEGAVLAMKEALKRSGLEADRIDYINLHGTGTKFNDSMEAIAVNEVFKNNVFCSTTKPVTGHTLGAAGSLEAAICWMTLKENEGKLKNDIKLPVQVWDGCKDESFPELNFVNKNTTFETKKDGIKTVMSNSFAFGGANASLILGF